MTTQTLRTRRDIREVGDDCYWLVFGPAGVISWGLLAVERISSCFGPVGIHSPRQQLPDIMTPDLDCPFLEMPCYFDFGARAGGRLGKAWDAADRDDDVIWAELESWYADRLAGLAVAK